MTIENLQAQKKVRQEREKRLQEKLNKMSRELRQERRRQMDLDDAIHREKIKLLIGATATFGTCLGAGSSRARRPGRQRCARCVKRWG